MKKFAAILSVALFAGGIANASVLVEEASFALTTVNFTGQSLVIPQFNPSLGTLTSVKLQFLPTGTIDSSKHTEISSSGYLQNLGGSAALNLGFGVKVQFSMSGDPNFSGITLKFTDNVFDNIVDQSGSLAAYTGTLWNGVGSVPADSTRWTNLTALMGDSNTNTGGVSTVTVNCGSCSRFIGGSNFTISNIGASGNLNGSFPVSNQNSITTVASAVVDVTYNYTPAAVPEPGTYALLGSALIGLAGFRKKLTRKA